MSNKKKIIHVAQSAGGVYRYLELFFKYTNRTKYEVILIASDDYLKYENKLNNLVDKVEIIPMQRELSIVDDYNAVVKLKKIIKQHNPDIIYAHSSKAGGLTRLACLTNAIPIIYNPHGWAFNMSGSKMKKEIYVMIEKLLAFRTQKIINISNFEMKSALNNKVGNESKNILIYNGIEMIEKNQDESFKSYLEERFNFSTADSFIIGAVGRISKQKSPLDFVEVANLVSQKIPNAIFLWVGDGEDRNQMEQLIEQYNLQDKVLITGWVENPEAYIDIFDVALLLSQWEGFGLVLTEYMLHKKPIIATKVDAIPELVNHNSDGFIVEPHDINAVSFYISTYFSNVALTKSFVEKAYRKVNELFNIERVVEEHDTLFKEILGERDE